MASTPPSSSKVPPAVWGAVTAVLMALAAWLTALAKDHAEPANPPRNSAEPASHEPIGEPRDLDGDALTRWVRERANTEIKELRQRIEQLETHVCTIKRDVRETRGEVVQIEGAKRKPAPRDEYNKRTAEWLVCPAPNGGPLQTLPSLDDAANGALGR